MKIAKFITINIGLEAKGRPIHYLLAIRQCQRQGLIPDYSRVDIAHHERGKEMTLVVYVPYVGELDDFVDDLYRLAVNLDQDCIAYAYEHEGQLIGGLAGPKAEDWGTFKAEYFLPYDDALDGPAIHQRSAPSVATVGAA